MISLDDPGNVSCCKGKQNFYFYTHNVTALGTKIRFLSLNQALKQILLTFASIEFIVRLKRRMES